MKKSIITFVVLFVLLTTAVFAASVTRTLPTLTESSTTVTVSLTIADISSDGVEMAIEETLPADATLQSWSIAGSATAKGNITVREEDGRVAWAFVPSADTVTIQYTVALPSEYDSQTFGPLVGFDKSGMFNKAAEDLVVRDVVVQEPTTTIEPTVDTTPTNTMDEVQEPAGESKGIGLLGILGIIIIVLVVIGVIVALMKKR